MIIKSRYCVIIYISHFCPPGFSLIPTLYTKFPALYANIGSPCSVVPAAHILRIPIGFLRLWSAHFPCVHVVSITCTCLLRSIQIGGVTGGGGGCLVGGKIAR